jgi:hypothetical protein
MACGADWLLELGIMFLFSFGTAIPATAFAAAVLPDCDDAGQASARW